LLIKKELPHTSFILSTPINMHYTMYMKQSTSPYSLPSLIPSLKYKTTEETINDGTFKNEQQKMKT